MGLDLDRHATCALDEGLHRPYVFTNAMRRILPMHVHVHVIRVVTGEDALPVRLVPAREIELVHPLKIARYCFVDHCGCLLSGDSYSRTRACSASRYWRRSSNASEPGGAAASERLAWATMASAMERSPAVLGYAFSTSWRSRFATPSVIRPASMKTPRCVREVSRPRR